MSVTLKGNPVEVRGEFPAVGTVAAEFSLVGADLADVSLSSLAGQRKVLNIFPSVDTPVCAASVRKFNAAAGSLANTVVLCISADLPFAQGRFCGAEGISNVTMLSTMRGREFLKDYGVAIETSPLTSVEYNASDGSFSWAALYAISSGNDAHTNLSRSALISGYVSSTDASASLCTDRPSFQ